MEENIDLEEDKNTNQHKFKTVISSLLRNFKAITIEPCIFIYFFAVSVETILYTEIMMKKTCSIYLNYSEEICANSTLYPEAQILIEKNANKFVMYSTLIQTLPALLFVLFVGPWSDRFGRKIPLLLPFVGKVLSSLINGMNTYFWLLKTEFLLLSAIPSAFTGGSACLIMSMFSYISDISTKETRTSRIALMHTCIILSASLGLLASSFAKIYLHYTGTYIFVGILYLTSVVYIIFFVKETRGPRSVIDVSDYTANEFADEQIASCSSLFDVQNIILAFKVTFKQRPNFARSRIILLITSLCLMVLTINSMSIEYFFVQLKFGWDYQQFIYWIVITITIQSIGLVIVFPIMLKLMHNLKDELMAVVGAVGLVAHYFIQCFAVKGYQMYIASIFALFGGLPMAIARSALSKLVPEQSTGKLFSVVAVVESILPLIASPMYTLLYNSTIKTLPGAFLLLSSSFYLISAVNYVAVYILGRRTCDDGNLLVVDTTDD